MSEHTPQRKKHHVFLLVFLALQALFIIWIISGSITASHDVSACTTDACRTGAEAGTGIGIGAIVLLWALTDIIVGGTYGIYRLARRPR